MTTIIDDAALQDYSIRELFAAIACDGKGGEGIVALQLPGLGVRPIVFSDQRKLERYGAQLAEVARVTGKTIQLRTFRAVSEEGLS